MGFYHQQVWLTAAEAQQQVRNIFCVGRNYRDHATELGNAVPQQPMIFGKWTHALVPCQGKIYLPAGRDNIHHELELVLWLNRAYQAGTPWTEYIGGMALGLDLTDRDAQNQLKAAGQPWEYAKSFQSSGVVTDFYHVTEWPAVADSSFSLEIDGRVIQEGQASEMVFSFEQLIEYVGTVYGFGAGDMLFTGTPAGVGPLHPGQQLKLKVGAVVWGACTVA